MPSGNPEHRAPPGLILPPQGADPREAFLVLPGLNLHPHRLDPLTAVLHQAGAATVAPALTGFARPGDPALRRVRAEHWLADLDAAWAAARARLPEAEPALLGFSLGGLLGLVWAQARGLTLRRAALLAPGLRLKPLHRALIERVMPLLPRGLWLPSVSPRSYRFHAGTTLSAYRTVATLQRRLAPRLRAWQRGEAPGLPPLLIAYAAGDELVDTRVFEALAAALPERVTLVPLAHRPRPGFPRHLALDAHTLGEAEWQRLAATLDDWLHRTAPGTARGPVAAAGAEATASAEPPA